MAQNDRDEAIKTIRTALKHRSGKTWSVTGGRGTSWGWITITAPPARRDKFDCMTPEDQAELGALLNLGRSAHHQGETVAASSAYRTEYIQRARGETVTTAGTPYWD